MAGAQGQLLPPPPLDKVAQVDDISARIFLCNRLLLPLLGPGTCTRRSLTPPFRVCGLPLDEGHHAQRCAFTLGVRTAARHNPMVRELQRFCLGAGRTILVEQRAPVMGDSARLDLVQLPGPYGGRAFFDVSVVHAISLTPSILRNNSAEPGCAASRRYGEKLVHYNSRVAGTHFVPLIWETGGRSHPAVRNLLTQLAKETALTKPHLPSSIAAPLLHRWLARLSATLIRGNAAAHLRLTPHLDRTLSQRSHPIPLPSSECGGACLFEALVS